MPKFIEAQMLESEMPPPTPIQIHKLISTISQLLTYSIVEAVCSFIDNMIIIFDLQGLKIGGSMQRLSEAGPSSKLPPQKG